MPAGVGRGAGLLLALAVIVLVAACDGDDPPLFAGDITSTTRRPSPTVELTTTTAPPSDAPSTTAPTAPAGAEVVLTPTGLGPLQIGMAETAAAETGFIGAIGPGCEASGSRSAPLTAGDLRGSAEFAEGALGVVTVTGGATTEEGTAVGDSLAAVEATYATEATVDVERSFEDMFGIWLVTVIRADGGIYQMVVDPATESVSSMAVPGVAFCE